MSDNKKVENATLKAIEALTKAIGEQGKTITGVGKRVAYLEQVREGARENQNPPMPPMPTMQTPPPVKVETPPVQESVTTAPQDIPVPADYRVKVDEILGKDFGISITPFTDRPSFMLNIIVPARFKTLTPEQLEIAKCDMRSKQMTYAEGTRGVEEWCKKIRINLNKFQETQGLPPIMSTPTDGAMSIGDGR